MADEVPMMKLIITNPSMSGRSMVAVPLVCDEEGNFAPMTPEVDIVLADGLTTIVEIPVGGRLIIREAHEPAMSHAMAVHPKVTDKHPKK